MPRSDVETNTQLTTKHLHEPFTVEITHGYTNHSNIGPIQARLVGAVVYTEDLLPKKRLKMFNSGNFDGRGEGVEIAFWCIYQVF